tara:strand:- start:26 stop:520 length:495 start_codon:yes stop_codon:yes gene_type:complete
MKKLLFLLVVSFSLQGCGSFKTFETSNLATNVWIEEPILNSQIDTSGNEFFKRMLSDGTTISLYYDSNFKDSGYVYTTLMQDFGWVWDGDKWGGSAYNRTTKLGHIFINPKKRLALHIDFQNEYRAFKVKVIKSKNKGVNNSNDELYYSYDRLKHERNNREFKR